MSLDKSHKGSNYVVRLTWPCFIFSLCSTHHVAIWKRNVSSWGSPWKTLCQETDKISLEIDGGSAVIEFRSGATVSPYLYTGFRATVQFIHTGALVPTTEPSHSLVQNPKSETGRVASPGGKARRPLSQHQGHPAVSRKTVHLPITPSSNNYGDDDDDEEDDDDDDDEDEEYSGPVMGSPRAPYGTWYFIEMWVWWVVLCINLVLFRCQRCSSNNLWPHFRRKLHARNCFPSFDPKRLETKLCPSNFTIRTSRFSHCAQQALPCRICQMSIGI